MNTVKGHESIQRKELEQKLEQDLEELEQLQESLNNTNTVTDKLVPRFLIAS